MKNKISFFLFLCFFTHYISAQNVAVVMDFVRKHS